MLPDTELSSGFGSKDGPQPDGRPTAAFMSNSDIQAVQALGVQNAGGDFVDMSSTATTRIENSIINVYTDSPKPPQPSASSPPETSFQSGFISQRSVYKKFRSVLPSFKKKRSFGESASATLPTVAPESPVGPVDFTNLPVELKPSLASGPTPAETYVSHLMCSGHGLPCWEPGPRQPELQSTGIVPGDVGTYSVEDGFTKLFNLWDAEVTKKMAASCYSNTYSSLRGKPAIVTTALAEGTVVAPEADCHSPLPPPPHQGGIVHEFRFPQLAGGILAVLSAANMECTNDKEAMRSYIIQYANPIYRHALTKARFGHGDSLYFITGCIKTDAWARAAYQPFQVYGPSHIRLLQLSRTPSSVYRWTRQPAKTFCGHGSSGVGGLKNQTLFLQGFKLAFSPRYVQRMKQGLTVTTSGRPGDLPRGPSTDGGRSRPFDSPHPDEGKGSSHNGGDSHTGGGPSQPKNGGTHLGTSATLSGGSQKGVSVDMGLEDGIECSQFPPSSKNYVYHPSDIINEILLDMTGADISLSHDDDWRHAFLDLSGLGSKDCPEVATDCPDSSDIEMHGSPTEEGLRLAIALQNGVAYPSTPSDQVHSIDSQHNPTEVNSKLVDRPSNSLEGSQPSNNTGVLEIVHGEGTSKQTVDSHALPTSLNSSPLLNLPCEILTQIFLPLPVPDILRSQAVCSSVKSFITSSEEIQYRIALEISGLEDNKSCSSFSTPGRLKRISKAQKAWQSFEPQFTTTFTDPSPLRTATVLEGGAILQFDRQTSGINYAALPLEKEEVTQWRHIDSAGGCFNACLCTDERDLVVAPKSTGIEGDTFDITLHLWQISTGLPHPQAEQPVLLASKGEYLEPDDTRVGINGENLAVLLRYWQRKASLPDRVLVFEWKTGMLKASLEANRSYCALGFLEESLLVLPNIQHGTLEIWDISLTASVPPTPALICTLKLPDLAPGASFSRIMCNLKTTQAQHRQRPYRCSVEDSIISFSAEVIDTDGDQHCFPFFVHRKSLLQVIKDSSPCDGIPLHSPIAWEQWGQKTTRWIVTNDGLAGRSWRSAGQRTVYRAGRSILVMDFNSWSVKKCRYMLTEKRHEFQGEREERRDTVQTQQSPTKVAGRFKECELVTSQSVTESSVSDARDKDLVAEGDAGSEDESESEDGSGPDDDASTSQGRAPRTTWTLPETSIADSGGNCFLSPVKSELPCVCYKTDNFPNYDYMYMDVERIVGFKEAWSDEPGEYEVHYFG